MDQQQRSIDDLFREELNSYSEAPPPMAWDAMQKRLKDAPPGRPGAWFRKPGYLALLCLVMLTGVAVGGKIVNSFLSRGDGQNTSGSLASSSTPNASIPAPTLTPNASTPNASILAPTLAPNASIPAPTLTPNASTPAPTLTPNASIPAPTLTPNASIPAPTLTPNTSTPAPTLTPNASTPAPILTPATPTLTQTSSAVDVVTASNQNSVTLNASIPNPTSASSTGKSASLTTSSNTPSHSKQRPTTLKTKNSNTSTSRKNGHHSSKQYASNKNNHQAHGNYASNNNTEDSEQPTRDYNSAPPENAPASANDNPTNDNPQQNPPPGQQQSDNHDSAIKSDVIKPTPPKPHRSKFQRFEAGIKGGYEAGFNNDAAKKLVASPYIQYNVTPRLSVMLQPSVKGAQLQSRRIGTARSYYKENNDSSIQQGPTIPILIDGVPTISRTDFYYSQSHDSIVKSNSIGGNYIEYDIPVLLKYRVNKWFSAYGGVDVGYSKPIGIHENTYNNKVQVGPLDTSIITYPGQTPIPNSVNSMITYKGTEISNYTNPYPLPTGDMWRLGYMVGFTMEDKRWLFDGLLQQAPAKTNVQAGYNVNSALSAPYFRFTIGYKIIK